MNGNGRLPRLVQYPGHKFMLAETIEPLLGKHKIFCEPYAGFAAVLFHKSRSQVEVINEMNPMITDVFRTIRIERKAREVRRLLDFTPYSREEYFRIRDLTWKELQNFDDVERARIVIAKSWMGWNGFSLLRRNIGFSESKVKCIVPSYLRACRMVVEIGRRLRGVIVEQGKALDCIRRYDAPETVFYVDPPYPHGTRDENSLLYHDEMTDDDHEELIALLKKIEGGVIVSTVENDVYSVGLGAWHREQVSISHRSNAGGKSVTELLYMNSKMTMQMSLFENGSKEGARDGAEEDQHEARRDSLEGSGEALENRKSSGGREARKDKRPVLHL